MSKLIESKLPCPRPKECGSSDAYHKYDDGHGYCFSCKHYFPPDRPGYRAEEEGYTYEYLPWRGIKKETMEFYDIKTKINASGEPISLGYLYSNGSYKVRLLAGKSFHSIGDISKAGLFGSNKHSSGGQKYVTITEGEADAAALYQALGQGPVVSVQSASTARRDCTVDRSFLAGFERVYLAFDNDTAGNDAVREVASLFDFRRVYRVKFSKHKDPLGYVEAGEEEELRKIWWNSRKYLPETIVSSFQDFSDILLKPAERGISYPFLTLNKMTEGIRKGESVLFTALEGVGKTELMHALEYHILKETPNDVGVGAIFLEESSDRHLKALASIQLQKPVHLESSGVTQAETIRAVEELVKCDDRLHISTHFGSDDPDNILETIRFLVTARGCAYIIVDHIGMVCSGLGGEDERRALEYICTRLEMMVKELNFALLFVSHVNDEGQTRTSRWVAKIADIRIDLKRDFLNTNPEIANTVELIITKPSRFTGKAGKAGKYLHYPNTKEWKEIEDVGYSGDQVSQNRTSFDRSSQLQS